MLMDPDDGAINERVFEVWVLGQVLEDGLEDALQSPSAEAAEGRVPIPELFMQIAPGSARAGNPEYRFKKEPIVGRPTAGITAFTRQQRRDPLPLLLAQDIPIQGQPPFSSLESNVSAEGNLLP